MLEDAIKQGRINDVLGLARAAARCGLDKRPTLRVAVAWALALGERHVEAQRQIAGILADSGTPAAMRYECALILSAAAYYADEIDRFVELFGAVGRLHAAGGDVARANACEPAVGARDHRRRAGAGAPLPARQPRGETAAGFGCRALERADHGPELPARRPVPAGRRRAVAGAGACGGRSRAPPSADVHARGRCARRSRDEADRVDQAAALLANRLDVLEHAGTPDTVLLGLLHRRAHRTAARRREHRAIDLPKRSTRCVARRLPRLSVASLAEQVRIHAARYREATCHALVERIDAIAAARVSVASGRRAAPRRAAAGDRARGCAGRAPLGRRARALDEAAVLAREMSMGQARIEIMALSAFALEQSEGGGRALLDEAMNLADVPARARWSTRIRPSPTGRAAPAPRGTRCRSHASCRPLARVAASPRAMPSVVLTPGRARDSRAACAQPVEQGDRGGAGVGEENREVAPEEPVRQARRQFAHAWCAARWCWVSSKARP